MRDRVGTYQEIHRPSISPAQARAARAMLSLSVADASRKAGIAKISFYQFEAGQNRQRAAESDVHHRLRDFYESHGIEFYARHGVSFLGGVEVTPAQERMVNELRGEDVFA